MYSWMPKLWTLRSKCSAAAIATGLRSVAPCDPVRTWCSSRERRDLPQVADAAAVHDGHADVVDQLLFDELRAVVDRVEHLADRNRRRRVLADGAERRLVLRRHRILQPEQPRRLEALAEPRRFDRRQAMVHVVEQVHVEADLAPQPFEQRRHEVEIPLRAPHALERLALLRRLVIQLAAADASPLAEQLLARARSARGVPLTAASDRGPARHRRGAERAGDDRLPKFQNDLDGAEALHRESFALRQELGDNLGGAKVLGALAHLAFERSDFDGAAAYYEEALALYRRVGNRR